MDNLQALETRVDELASLVRTLTQTTPTSDTHIIDALVEQVDELRAQMKTYRSGVDERTLHAKLRKFGNDIVNVVTPPIAARIKEVSGEIKNSRDDLARLVDEKLHTVNERSIKSMSAHAASGVIAGDILNSLVGKEL